MNKHKYYIHLSDEHNEPVDARGADTLTEAKEIVGIMNDDFSHYPVRRFKVVNFAGACVIDRRYETKGNVETTRDFK